MEKLRIYTIKEWDLTSNNQIYNKILLQVNNSGVNNAVMMSNLSKEYADMVLKLKGLNFNLNIISQNQISKYILHMVSHIHTQN